jgi:hypothetical protein
MSDERPDPFLVTDLEERVYRLVLAAARGGRLGLRTGTYKGERVSFLCVEVEGARHPVAMVLRPDDAKHLRDANLAPARKKGATT